MSRLPIRVLPLVIVVGLVAAACGKKQPPAAPPPAPTATPAPVANNPPPPPPPRPNNPTVPTPPPAPTEAEIFARMTLADLNNSHPLDDVYFEFDKSELSAASRASLQKDADWMRKWPSTKVTVEGHADARGTNEYNLALGERRASSIRDYLVTLNVTVSRVSVVSKGKKSPCAAKRRK